MHEWLWKLKPWVFSTLKTSIRSVERAAQETMGSLSHYSEFVSFKALAQCSLVSLV